MGFKPVLPLTLLVICFMVSSTSSSSSSYNFPIAKPGCPDRCGDVSIPFPFGIGKGCYREESLSFSVECNDSRLSFPGSPFSITDISLEGQFRTSNYVGYDCYDGQNQNANSSKPWSSLRKPFIFNNTANKFTVTGCDTYAFVRGRSNLRRYTTGCLSICDKKEDVTDNFCSGIGCCQTSIPSGAWQINVSLNSFNNHSLVSNFNPCSYAFVVAEDAFQFSVDNLTNLASVQTMPVIVDWVISYNNCDEAKTNKSSYACGVNSECYVEEGSLGYRCRCSEGYEGNPYQGCQDINECQILGKCDKYHICNNKMGSYECKYCIPGYHEDSDGRCVVNNKKNNWPIILGVGLSGGAVSLMIFSFCLYSIWIRRKAKMYREEFFRKNGGLILLQKLGNAQDGGTYSIRIFTQEELRKATNDFHESEIIGRGGFGTVFRGEFMDGKVVAIKKSRGVDEHQAEQFINEVILLSQINSRYVVKLLGCCLETEVPLLVYEYIDNGTLLDHLHNKIKASNLSWNIRLRIASEVAGVLSYLHSIASPPIIHRDIKSSNILLDQNYIAKVSDFGISKLISSEDDQVVTMVQGTLGYLDPEYMQTGLLNEKSDVYSFGIVLMELLTGKKVLDSNKPEAEKFLSNDFLALLKEKNIAQILDNNISCPENVEQLIEVAMIAKRCISVRGEDRPCMKDVERALVLIGAKAKAKEISVQVFEIDSSKSEEVLLGKQSIEFASFDNSTSSSQFSASSVTMDQPLLSTFGGR